MGKSQVAELQRVIKQIKIDKNLTQHQVADTLNVSRNGLDRFMTGKRERWKDIEQAVQLHFASYYSFNESLEINALNEEIQPYTSALKAQEKNIKLLEEIIELKDNTIEQLRKELDDALNEAKEAKAYLDKI